MQLEFQSIECRKRVLRSIPKYPWREFACGKENWTIYIRFFAYEGAEVYLETEPNRLLVVHIREKSYAMPHSPKRFMPMQVR